MIIASDEANIWHARMHVQYFVCVCVCVCLFFFFQSFPAHRVHTSLSASQQSPVPDRTNQHQGIHFMCVKYIDFFFFRFALKGEVLWKSIQKKNSHKSACFLQTQMIISSSLMHCQIIQIVHSEWKIKLKTPTWCLFLFYFLFFFFTLVSHSPTVLHRPAVFHLSQQLSTQWGLEADKVSSLEASIIAFACIKEKVLGNLLDFDSYISSIRRKKKETFTRQKWKRKK